MTPPKLSCPFAEYKSGMVIHCKKQGDECGNVYFCRANGWWALNPMSDLCPLRRETNGERKPSASGKADTI